MSKIVAMYLFLLDIYWLAIIVGLYEPRVDYNFPPGYGLLLLSGAYYFWDRE